MKSFNIKKQETETIDIEGMQFEVDITTSNVKEMVLKGHELQEKAKEIEDMSEDATKEEQLQAIEEVENLLKESTNFVLGEGAFEKIYPKTNESIYVMADVLYQVIDYLYDKQQKENEKMKQKYVQKRKK